MRSPERSEQMADANRLAISSAAENFGLLDVTADPENQTCRQQTDREQDTPGDRLGQKRVERGIDKGRGAPADRPTRLHDANPAAAVFVADNLAHQHGAGSPFAAEAEPVQCPQHEELLEVLREGAKEREYRIPQDRDLQHPHAAEPVGERAREPPAQ